MMPKTLLEPRVFNRSTSRLVYPAAWYSWPKLFESSVLCRQHGFKATSSFRAGLPNNHGPFKLARIAPHFHSGLCNKNISSPNLLLTVDGVGNRRVSTHLSPEAHYYRRQGDFQLDIGLSHFPQHSRDRIVAQSNSDQSLMKTGVSILQQDIMRYLRPFYLISEKSY